MNWSRLCFVTELDHPLLLPYALVVDEFISSEELLPHPLSGVWIFTFWKFMMTTAPSVNISGVRVSGVRFVLYHQEKIHSYIPYTSLYFRSFHVDNTWSNTRFTLSSPWRRLHLFKTSWFVQDFKNDNFYYLILIYYYNFIKKLYQETILILE